MLKNGSKKGFLLVKMDFAFLPTAFIVYRILVHYRVGSLEIQMYYSFLFTPVHYRVGSLEMLQSLYYLYRMLYPKIEKYIFKN